MLKKSFIWDLEECIRKHKDCEPVIKRAVWAPGDRKTWDIIIDGRCYFTFKDKYHDYLVARINDLRTLTDKEYYEKYWNYDNWNN